jgi:hypothetical protein
MVPYLPKCRGVKQVKYLIISCLHHEEDFVATLWYWINKLRIDKCVYSNFALHFNLILFIATHKQKTYDPGYEIGINDTH